MGLPGPGIELVLTEEVDAALIWLESLSSGRSVIFDNFFFAFNLQISICFILLQAVMC